MEIRDRTDLLADFGDLPVGTIFKFLGYVHVKVDTATRENNAFNFSTGSLVTQIGRDRVRPVKATLEIE